MNNEIKKIVSRVKTAQAKLQAVMKNQDWMDDAKKYAEKQRKEVQKLLASDLGKVKTFVEKERKELEKFQKQIPGEVKRFKDLLGKQRKELEKVLGNIGTVRKKAAQRVTKKASSRKKQG